MKMRLAIPIGAAVLLTGCNLYSGLDHPSGNTQLLSAARACFDRNDLTCAQGDYAKISGSLQDQATAESSFTYLDQQGASMAAFMTFIGNIGSQGTGGALTQFAESLSPAGETRRLGIWQAYSMSAQIQDSSLQAFAEFLSSTALAVELLAEDGSSPGVLAKTDIAQNPTGCMATGGCTNAVQSTDCDQGNGGLSNSNTEVLSTSQPPTDIGSPSYDQLYDAVTAAASSLAALSASGRFANAATTFNSITTITINGTTFKPSDTVTISLVNYSAARCFRYLLLQQGIGQ